MEAYPKVYLYKRIVQAKLFIDQNFAKTIDLDAIADEAIFSKFHFIRQFKLVYGQTPHQYLTHVRMAQARHLLHNTQGTVLDVCLKVGFDSLSSFTSLFKKLHGITPAAYQAQQRFLKELAGHQPRRFIPGCFAGEIPEKQF